MDLPSRLDIQRHKLSWGADQFLICRSVTPPEFRELDSCNCFPCRKSRIYFYANLLSHPFGSHVNPPMSRFAYSEYLRSTLDLKNDIFAESNAFSLLRMMFTDPENRSFDHWPMYISPKTVPGLVRDLLSTHPLDNRSLNGLFYSALRWHSLKRKGPRLLMRARRSHSVRPSPHLYSIPETYDTWCSKASPDFDVPEFSVRYPDFAKFPSSIERLVRDGYFHNRVNRKFSDFVMSDSTPTNQRFKRTRSLVSFYSYNGCFREDFS